MTLFIIIAFLIMGGLLGAFYHLKQRAESAATSSQLRADEAIKQRDEEVARVRAELQNAIAKTRTIYEQKIQDLDAEAKRIQEHYDSESRKVFEAANERVAQINTELEPLRAYAALKDAESTVRQSIADAIAEATELKREAQELLEKSRDFASAERQQAQQRAREVREQAEALLTQATRDAGRIFEDAEKRAEKIGADAYIALRDKNTLEQAVKALWNVTEGYGDRYVIPTHSVLDDLAIDFGYTQAGQSLRAARDQSRRMVEQKQASSNNYEEVDRRERANRFVIDAFNGRVDAILSRAKHDNYGTLEQEIRDAYSIVNLNGLTFRDAHILPAYLDTRLAELRWAVVVQELARKQREEQRYLKERLRDEQKAEEERRQKQREAAKEKEQAAREEELKKAALEQAEKNLAGAHAEDKALLERQVQKLREEVADANQKVVEATTRELTIAQQTKKGHVYIISNVGSFGEGIYKIGLTRRDPQVRVDELGGASVPFEFDIHGVIETENAPALEHTLHKQFLAMQVNKTNPRKEFFRVALKDIRTEVDKLMKGEDFTIKSWTETALATEYKDSLDIEKNPEKRENWLTRQKTLSARQIKMDQSQLLTQSGSSMEDDDEET